MTASAPLFGTREQFVTWQCRLRQRAMRHDGGRPSAGMRPRVVAGDGTTISAGITVVIVDHDASATADLLRHAVQRTHDPRQRYEDGLRLLSSEYYQDPRRFSGLVTALFPAHSTVARALQDSGRCVLHFDADGRTFTTPCDVLALPSSAPAYQLTYWHGCVFAAAPETDACVLAFDVDWARTIDDARPR